MLQHVYPYIKKLHIEGVAVGGGGLPIYRILSKIPGLVFIIFLQKGRRAVSAAVSNSSTLNTSSFVTLKFCIIRGFFPHVLTFLIRFHMIIRMMNICGAALGILAPNTAHVIRVLQL
jgi:hypothetical protein